MERLSVMARTADIHVRARRGSTTQELQSEALLKEKREQHYVVACHTPDHNQPPPFTLPESVLLCGTKTINLETTKQITLEILTYLL